jgi:hypothetical protein
MTRAEARVALREATGCSFAETRRLIPDPSEPSHAELAAMAMLALITSRPDDDEGMIAWLAHRQAAAMITERESRREP